MPEPHSDAREGVISAAVLMVASFKLREESAMVAALRQLVGAVDAMEKADNDAESPADFLPDYAFATVGAADLRA